jgi:hypothetical protein
VLSSRRPRPADPDFDPPPASSVRLRDFNPLEFQRLVINPFLAVFGLLILAWLAFQLANTEFPPLFLLMLLPLALLHHLIQYHCIDCGRIGRYHRRERHVCRAVHARWHEGHPSRFPFRSSRAQLVIWCWIIASVALLVLLQAWR